MRNSIDLRNYQRLDKEHQLILDDFLGLHGIHPNEVTEVWFQRHQTVVYGYRKTADGHIVFAPYGFGGPYRRVWRLPHTFPPPRWLLGGGHGTPQNE